jgi:sulfate transport system permease protein
VSSRVLPGFSLTLGWSVLYLGALVLVPLAACLVEASSLTFHDFVRAVWTDRARAAYWVTFSTAFAAAVVDVALGLLLSWVLVRYSLPGRRVLDALVDLPLALPTSVAGLVYASLYGPRGFFGRLGAPLGIHAAYSRLGIVLVLVFVGLPLVVRTVQPVLAEVPIETEEAAHCLGATRLQAFLTVILPCIRPALLGGFALAFARGIGEYGAVVFVSGNMPFKTEIAPLLVVARLEEFAYAEATAIAVVLVAASFALLFLIHRIEAWSRRHES